MKFQQINERRLINGGMLFVDEKGIEHFAGTNIRGLMGATLYERC